MKAPKTPKHAHFSVSRPFLSPHASSHEVQDRDDAQDSHRSLPDLGEPCRSPVVACRADAATATDGVGILIPIPKGPDPLSPLTAQRDPSSLLGLLMARRDGACLASEGEKMPHSNAPRALRTAVRGYLLQGRQTGRQRRRGHCAHPMPWVPPSPQTDPNPRPRPNKRRLCEGLAGMGWAITVASCVSACFPLLATHDATTSPRFLTIVLLFVFGLRRGFCHFYLVARACTVPVCLARPS